MDHDPLYRNGGSVKLWIAAILMRMSSNTEKCGQKALASSSVSRSGDEELQSIIIRDEAEGPQARHGHARLDNERVSGGKDGRC